MAPVHTYNWLVYKLYMILSPMARNSWRERSLNEPIGQFGFIFSMMKFQIWGPQYLKFFFFLLCRERLHSVSSVWHFSYCALYSSKGHWFLFLWTTYSKENKFMAAMFLMHSEALSLYDLLCSRCLFIGFIFVLQIMWNVIQVSMGYTIS